VSGRASRMRAAERSNVLRFALLPASVSREERLDNWSRPAPLVFQEFGVQLLPRQFVKNTDADVMGDDAVAAIPCFLERQRTEDVIDKRRIFSTRPASPGPQLRRHEVEDGDTVEAGPAPRSHQWKPG